MIENETSNNEIAPSSGDPQSDREIGISRLAKIVDQDLIPKNIQEIKGVSGEVKISISRSKDVVRSKESLEFMILDGKRMSGREINERFVYLGTGCFDNLLNANIEGPDKYRRPIVFGSLTELTPDLLFVDMFETHPRLRGKGAGVAFQENLAEVAKI